MRKAVLIVVVMLAGCSYRPGTLTAVGPHGTRAELQRLGCLEVAVVPVIDSAANGPVAGFHFANRCNQPVSVDLRAVQATGVFADGRRRTLRVYDPKRQIRRGTLDARAVGSENLEYTLPEQAAPPVRLCLDLSALNASMRHQGPSVQVCIPVFGGPAVTTLARRRP